MSSNVKPLTLSTFWMAGTGPMPIISGGTPTAEYATTRANGFKLFWLIASSDANKTAAAPSQIPYQRSFFWFENFFTLPIFLLKNIEYFTTKYIQKRFQL